MANLVQVPWQTNYYLTPDTLAYLVAASNRLGTQLRLTDGWRSYAEQKALRDYYLADPVNHPFASDPDTGQRNHMRGAAFDLVRVDKATQDACRAVGLIRDAAESWHWNNPRWASMPIIPSLTDVAGSVATPIPTGDEVDMASREDIKADTAAVVRDALAPLMDDEARELDAARREGRLWRLFKNTDRAGQADEYVAIAYALRPDDPRQVIFLDERDALAIGSSYLMTADVPANARPLNADGIDTAIRLAKGTDRLFQAKPSA